MRKTLSLICLIFSLGAAAYGQTGGAGQIAGQVTDPSGKVIVGAKVTATNVETNVKTEAVTTDEGNYQLLQLPPALYQLDVEATGFKTLQRTGIRVQVSDRLEINLPLEVGLGSETVTITGEASLLRTQDAQQGEIVNQDMIQKLPQVERDPLRLLRIAGNVQGDGSRADGGSDTRINGGRSQGLDYLIDGITAGTGAARGVSGTTPSLEAVSEFKVITNGISAEYGRISGGAVELITRSGTNDFHGQVFEYVQNDILNANSWLQNLRGGKRTPFRQNNFGGAIGGPIFLPRFGEGGPSLYSGRDRTFFFFNYDGFRFSQSGQLQTTTVPTVLERQGDLTQTFYNGFPAIAYDPAGPQVFNTRENKWERLALLGGDGRRVPADRINPVSRAILNLVPLPNTAPRPGTSGAGNYTGVQDTTETRNLWALRLDHNFTENSRIFGRYTRFNRDRSETNWRGPLGTAPRQIVDGAFNGTINYDWTISPTLLFNARIGGHYNPFEGGNLLPDGFSSTNIPFDPITRRLIGGNEGLLTVGGAFMGQDVRFAQSPNVNKENLTTFQTAASMIKVLNRHTIKFGYEHRRYYDNYSSTGFSDTKFIYAPTARFAEDRGWDDESQASSIATFLLGTVNLVRVQGPSDRATNTNYHAAYIQDDFRVNTKLTLNLGLRWDMETPVTERFNRLYFWDQDAPSLYRVNPGYDFRAALVEAGIDPSRVPTPAWVTNGFPNGALRIAGTPESPSRYGQRWHPWQFAPRLGFAYQANDKTVLRGSFAQMYISTTGNPNSVGASSAIQTADGTPEVWHASDTGPFRNITSNFTNPYRPQDVNLYVRDAAVANLQGTGGDAGPSAFSRDSHMPYELTWSFGVQRELPKNFLVEAQYSANRGVGLLARDLISRFPRELYTGGRLGENGRLYRTLVRTPTFGQTRETERVALAYLMYPYPYYKAFQVLGANIGRSNYQSMNLRAERRFTESLAFLVNYTLGRALDNVGGPNADVNGINGGGGTGGSRYQSVDTVRDAYGYSRLDERHRLAITYRFGLPIGRGRALLGDPQGFGGKALDFVVGGWELAGITLYRSGRPVVFSYGNENSAGNDIRVEATFGSFTGTDRNLLNPNFGGFSSVLFSERDPRPTTSLFDATRIRDAESFVYGDVPGVYADIRQPSSWNNDLSLMKRFPFFSKDNERYLQFRVEANNVFNQRGFGDFNTQVGSGDFGLITGARYTERRIQMSARIVF